MNQAIEVACNNLMGFVIVAPNDGPEKARAVIADMVRAYNPADTIELNLVAQIVGFGLAAMDSLRRSIADPEMQDAKVLRCRASAASLSRSAEQCRAALNALRAAANPAERLPAPAKPNAATPRTATPSAATPSPADAQTEKAAAKARTLLNRLDQLHKEWDLSPIPMPAAPPGPAAPTPKHPPLGYG